MIIILIQDKISDEMKNTLLTNFTGNSAIKEQKCIMITRYKFRKIFKKYGNLKKE